MSAKARGHWVLMISIVLSGSLVAAAGLSFWREAGLVNTEETWVTPAGSGMMELHARVRTWLVGRGSFEATETEFLSAVIPAGSPAAGAPQHTSRLLWQPSAPRRVRAWDDRWHMTRWNEWRLGDLGYYETTGGASTSRVLAVPLWLVIAFVGVPCWFWTLRNLRAWRRRKRGVCVACGYDRRGIAAISTVCPECGAAGDVTP